MDFKITVFDRWRWETHVAVSEPVGDGSVISNQPTHPTGCCMPNKHELFSELIKYVQFYFCRRRY